MLPVGLIRRDWLPETPSPRPVHVFSGVVCGEGKNASVTRSRFFFLLVDPVRWRQRSALEFETAAFIVLSLGAGGTAIVQAILANCTERRLNHQSRGLLLA